MESSRTGIHRTGWGPIRPVLVVLLLLAPIPLQAGDDLFATVFGRAARQDLVLPVFRSGQFLGEVQARLEDERVLVGGMSLATMVEPFLNSPDHDALLLLVRRETSGGETLIPLERFSPAGLYLAYRPEQLLLELSLDPQVLREQRLGESRRSLEGPFLEPVPFSGYTNLIARNTIASGDYPGDLLLSLEPVLNYRGWVWESSLGFSSEPWSDSGGDRAKDDPLTLRYTRVVRDYVPWKARAEAGIVRYRAGSLLGSPEVAGISLTRHDEIDPDDPLYRSADARFVASRDTSVDIIVNDRLYRRVRVAPGPYRVPDLPLGRGVNEVRVEEASPDTGEPVVIMQEVIPFSPHLLRPGRHHYSWVLGVMREDFSHQGPFASGFHQRGITPDWTAGASLQATEDAVALGLQSLVASILGITRLGGALFADTGGERGGAGEISHLMAPLRSPRSPVVEVLLSLESAEYRPVSSEIAAGGRLRGGLIMTRRFSRGINLSLGMIHDHPFEHPRDRETTLRLAFSQFSSRGYSLNGQIAPSFSDQGVRWQGSVFLRLGSPDQRRAISSSYDLARDRSALQVANVPERAFGEVNWRVDYERIGDAPGETHSLGGSLRYDTFLGSLQTRPEARAGQETDQELSVQSEFSTALAWAGTSLAVTRPISESFALFQARDEIAGYPVPLRPGGGAVSAVLRGRTAVVPDLPSWKRSTVRIDGSELPEGLSVGERDPAFFPGYRQGYRVVVGSEATVYAVGRLIESQEALPLELEAGEAVSSTGDRHLFFTNRQGRFEIPHLAPGRYRLFLLGHPQAEATFLISPQSRGRYDLGDIPVVLEDETR